MEWIFDLRLMLLVVVVGWLGLCWTALSTGEQLDSRRRMGRVAVAAVARYIGNTLGTIAAGTFAVILGVVLFGFLDTTKQNPPVIFREGGLPLKALILAISFTFSTSYLGASYIYVAEYLQKSAEEADYNSKAMVRFVIIVLFSMYLLICFVKGLFDLFHA